ncbi:hypothetical protein ACFV0H_30205 [Streptomyces erythrochromogenes]
MTNSSAPDPRGQGPWRRMRRLLWQVALGAATAAGAWMTNEMLNFI